MAIPFFSREAAKPRYRYIAKSTQPVAAGKHKIQVVEGPRFFSRAEQKKTGDFTNEKTVV